VYGDATKERVVPFAFARELGFYIEDTGRMQREAEEAFRQKGGMFLKRRWESFYQREKEDKDRTGWARAFEVDNVRTDLATRRRMHGHFASYKLPYSDRDLVDTYIWLHEYKSAQELLKPYYTAGLRLVGQDRFRKRLR
jgi:hypothetical protein